jgi:hypothetical protein
MRPTRPSHLQSIPLWRESTSQDNAKVRLKNWLPACSEMASYFHISNNTITDWLKQLLK